MESTMTLQATESAAIPEPATPAAAEFEALDNCHREVLKTLDELARLIDHLEDNGVDTTAQALAADIVKFFNENGRQHHIDEEHMIFPGLLASGDAELMQHVQRLQQDHGWLEEDWLELEPQLEAISKGYSWYQLDGLRAALPVFKALYLDHIDLEESLIYPEAKRRQVALPAAGAGRDVAARRRKTRS